MSVVRPRLVLFDVDGTLVDTAGAGRRALERAFAAVFGVDGVRARASAVPFAGRTDPAIFRALAVALGLGAAAYEADPGRLHGAYLEALREEMARHDDRRRMMPGVASLLETLDGLSRIHVGLLTGNLEAGARIKLEPFGLNRYFPDGGFGSDDPDRREVARVAREKLSRRLGVPFDAADVVVVGDTEQDVECARANRYRAVAVAAGWCSRAALEASGPDALLDDLGDREAALAALGIGPLEA